jgi:hypothetical protein
MIAERCMGTYECMMVAPHLVTYNAKFCKEKLEDVYHSKVYSSLDPLNKRDDLEQNPKYSASHQNQEIMGSINSELTLGKSSHAGGGFHLQTHVHREM